MKKILYLSPQNVIPPTDGGKISIYYPIQELSKKNTLFFGYITNNDCNDTEAYKKINIIPIDFYKNTKDNILLILKNIFSKIPFKMEKYFDKRFLNILINLIKEEKIDVVICSHPHMAYYALELKKIFPKMKTILREHNIEYKLVEEYYSYERNFLRRFIANWQFKKTKKYEIYLWKQFDRVVFISDSDFAEAKKNINLDDRQMVIYDGFKCKNIDPIIKKEKDSFIFSGNLNSIQNHKNLNEFIKKIWMPLVENNKQYKLYITGNTNEILEKKLSLTKNQLEKLNIINLGFVENIDETIMSKEYFISPTYIGSGIRIKVLHALSLGMITFVSEKDYQMVKYFKDLRNVVKFKDRSEFIEKLRYIENNHNLKKDIASNARSLIKNELSWDNYRKKMEKIL